PADHTADAAGHTADAAGHTADAADHAAAPAGGTAAGREIVREVIARANSTLAAPSARIEFRVDTDIVRPEPPERQERPRPGPVGRLARRAAKAAWDRIAPGMDVADLREKFTHQVGEGF